MTTANHHQQKEPTKQSLRDSVLEQITTQNITPQKRWVFIVREIAIWIFALVAVVIGALGFAATIHSLSTSDIAFYLEGPGPLFGFLSSSLPFIWMFVILAMILLTRFQVRHAKNGYRYRFVVLLIVLATIILGMVFHLLQAGRLIERQLSMHAPQTVECFIPHHAPWERPEDGVLGGRIIDINNNEMIIIVRTPRQDDWTVFTERAEIRGTEMAPTIAQNQFVKILGETTGPLEFRADKIRIDDADDVFKTDIKPCRPPRPQGERK